MNKIKNYCGLGVSDNTLCEYDNEVGFDLLNHRLKVISKVVTCDNEHVCYLVGMGGVPKRTYFEIKNKFYADVIWHGSLLPKGMRFLSCIVASYAGLVKVNDPRDISDIFSLMIQQSMAGIYYFPKEYEDRFVYLVKINPISECSDFGIKKFQDYFFYMADADNSESHTGIYEVVSYGVGAKFISGYL